MKCSIHASNSIVLFCSGDSLLTLFNGYSFIKVNGIIIKCNNKTSERISCYWCVAVWRSAVLCTMDEEAHCGREKESNEPASKQTKQLNISVLNRFVWKNKCVFFVLSRRREEEEKNNNGRTKTTTKRRKEHINLFQRREENTKRKTIESDTCLTNVRTKWNEIQTEWNEK